MMPMMDDPLQAALVRQKMAMRNKDDPYGPPGFAPQPTIIGGPDPKKQMKQAGGWTGNFQFTNPMGAMSGMRR